jgi:glucose/arabinose dehydrogenase
MRLVTQIIIVLFLNPYYAQTIGIQPFASGLSNVVEIASPPNDSRLFAVQKDGNIKIVNSDGSINSTPFLTISGLSNGGEQGLLGLAFHPNYTSNGFFYINYTNTLGDTIIAQYVVSANPDIANATGTTLITIDQPYANHNGGSLKFGPDGFLYIAMGDGGNGGDPNNYAQNLNVLAGNRVFLGKILRINVDSGSSYDIPPTNPFIGQTDKEEIWAIGLRNPWKFSFNRSNGDLWIADVGQSSVEEINKVTTPLTAGLNFGWRCYEGNSAYNTSGCPTMSSLIFPFAEYTHTGGACSVTGGYYYTGSLYPNFQNKYFFADYCVNRIGYVTTSGTIAYSSTFSGSNNFTSFGEDKNGELYITNGSTIFKVIDNSLSNPFFEKSIFQLFPNPANGNITIINENNLLIRDICLADITGKIVHKTLMNDTTRVINISQNFSSGIYILSLTTFDENRYVYKLIVE